MERPETGVDRAITKMGGGPEGKRAIAALFGISEQAINNFARKGWFPTDRARVVSEVTGIPVADLVRADIRPLLNS